ncbi:hypothetical protein JCM17844_08220 [Iodidimonas gelatinilytica]|nr:ATP-binding protein [Iodidimonas gelatinilytica]GEQ97185.1 hypothetical protein JCM17844_08220 [Iodidimonas gelatinilytica]
MTEDEIVTALSPFGQSDTSYTRHHDGIGLGIPIVENLTTLQNGTFSIRSKPGEGTTVTITLPQAS